MWSIHFCFWAVRPFAIWLQYTILLLWCRRPIAHCSLIESACNWIHLGFRFYPASMLPQNKMNRNKTKKTIKIIITATITMKWVFFFAWNRIRIRSRHMLLGFGRKPLLADRLFEVYFYFHFHFRYSILITASKLFISRSTLGTFGMPGGWSMNHVIETAGFGLRSEPMMRSFCMREKERN